MPPIGLCATSECQGENTRFSHCTIEASDAGFCGAFIISVATPTYWSISLTPSLAHVVLAFSISKLSYKTSGTLKLNEGGKIFSVKDEEITINNFYGGLLIEDKEFHINGYINILDIKGDLNIHIES